MTAPDPRLDEIQARLSAATPGPWDTVQDTYRSIPMHRIGSEETGSDVAQVVMHGSHDVADAEFIATAPTDIAYLLAELRKAREALGRVEALHKRVEGYQFGAIPGAEPDWPVCSTCFTDDEHPQPWPCPTAAAVAAAKGDERG